LTKDANRLYVTNQNNPAYGPLKQEIQDINDELRRRGVITASVSAASTGAVSAASTGAVAVAASGRVDGSGSGVGSLTVNVYGAPGQSEAKLAALVKQEILNAVRLGAA
jgi:hypothetical protein